MKMRETTKVLKELLPSLLDQGFTIKQIAEKYLIGKSWIYKTIKRIENEKGLPEGSLLPHQEKAHKGYRGSGTLEPNESISEEEINSLVLNCDQAIASMENTVKTIDSIITAS